MRSTGFYWVRAEYEGGSIDGITLGLYKAEYEEWSLIGSDETYDNHHIIEVLNVEPLIIPTTFNRETTNASQSTPLPRTA